ncbi:MAG: SCO family protein [bacterium]|jgi:protein SCO1/2|nr:MAG: SCO family protein [bacterium]
MSPSHRRAAALIIAAGLVLALGLAARLTRGGVGADEASLTGVVLADPVPKPDFTLPDTEGRPFPFRERTAGKLTLLFFGYTHCPDVCPVHMANLAAVLSDLAPETRDRIAVVFISADPERDTPERLREWLNAFDKRFIGLRGSLDEVNAILAELRLAPVIHGEPDEKGNYVVGHPAQILAFTPDGLLRALYPFGTRQTDWAQDLPRLLRFTATGTLHRADSEGGES